MLDTVSSKPRPEKLCKHSSKKMTIPISEFLNLGLIIDSSVRIIHNNGGKPQNYYIYE